MSFACHLFVEGLLTGLVLAFRISAMAAPGMGWALS